MAGINRTIPALTRRSGLFLNLATIIYNYNPLSGRLITKIFSRPLSAGEDQPVDPQAGKPVPPSSWQHNDLSGIEGLNSAVKAIIYPQGNEYLARNDNPL
jgi:hypothetical protein